MEPLPSPSASRVNYKLPIVKVGRRHVAATARGTLKERYGIPHPFPREGIRLKGLLVDSKVYLYDLAEYNFLRLNRVGFWVNNIFQVCQLKWDHFESIKRSIQRAFFRRIAILSGKRFQSIDCLICWFHSIHCDQPIDQSIDGSTDADNEISLPGLFRRIQSCSTAPTGQ